MSDHVHDCPTEDFRGFTVCYDEHCDEPQETHCLDCLRSALTTALRRAEEAEAIANQAMAVGKRMVEEAERDFHEVCESLGAVDEMHGIGFVYPDAGSVCDSIRELSKESGYYADMRTPRVRDEWREKYGPVLWWKLPVSEPPYAGTPLDDDFPDYVTHWTPISEPFGADGGSDA